MNQQYEQAIARLRKQHGDKLTPPQGVDHLIKYFGVRRVEVTGPYGVRRGRIGITTGWGPALLLMHRATSMSSSDVLEPEDKVTAIIHASGRRVPV